MVRIQDRLKVLLNKAASNIVFSLAKPPTPTYSQTPTATCPPDPDCSTFYCPPCNNPCQPSYRCICRPFFRRFRNIIDYSYSEVNILQYSSICGNCECDCKCEYAYMIHPGDLEAQYNEILNQNFEELSPMPTPNNSYICKNGICESVEEKKYFGYNNYSCCAWECEKDKFSQINCCVEEGGEWTPGCLYYNDKGECLEISYLPEYGKCQKKLNNIFEYYLIQERISKEWNNKPTPTPEKK